MTKKVRKIASAVTLGASDLAIKPIESALGAVTGTLTPQQAATGSVVADTTSTPTSVDPEVQAAREAQRRRQLAAAGLSSTIATSPLGATGAANTSMKTLLGS